MRNYLRLLAFALALLMCGAGLAWAEEVVSETVEDAGTETSFELGAPEEEAEAAGEVTEDIAEEMAEEAEEVLPKAAELMLTCTSATLGVDETLSLLPKEWTGDLPVFSTSNKKVATVSDAGVITAKKKGSATITATLDGATASCAVKVLKAPKSVTLNASSVTLGYDAALGLGERFALKPELTKDTASKISFTGYDPAVIAMEGNDVVAVGVGSTRVTVGTFNGKRATLNVTVLPAPETVAFDADAISISAGDSAAMKGSMSQGSASALTFESSDPAVAKVDGGKLTGVSQGTAVITVTCFNGVSASCDVTVLPAPIRVLADPGNLTLGVGEVSAPISAVTDTGVTTGFVFTSSKPKAASVTADGVVTGVKKGSATITVQSGRVSALVKVTVKAAPKSIALNTGSLTLGYDAATGAGEQATLKATLSKDSASALSFRGYDANVVAVDPDGTVRAVGCGTTKITVATFNNRTAVVNVTVLPGPERIALDAEQLTLGVKQSYALKAAAEGGASSGLTFESDDPGCLRVDAAGKLTAVAAGQARVTVTAFNGVSAVCDVTVVPEPRRVTATPAALTLGVGQQSVVEAATDVEGMAQTFAFSTSNKKYATVDASGVVKALKKGSTTIRVAAYNGVFADVKVTVLEAPKSVAVSPKTLKLALNDSAVLTATPSKNSAGDVTYKSSDETVARVDEKGLVTAVGYGTASITARTYNGRTDVCAVTVVAPAAEIIAPDTFDAVTATWADFPVRIVDAAGGTYQGGFEVAFEPNGVAEYENGRVAGVSAGSTTLVITAGEIEKRCEVSVVTYKSVHQVLSIAHRGGCGYKPENTLEAFRNARSLGSDGVELDARSTKDGYQVIHHDATFKVGSKKYTVAKLKLSELRQLKPSVPTLDEALDVLDREGLLIHLELKDTADGAKCVKAVRAHGLEDRTIYFSFYEKQLRQLYSADPTATLGMSLKPDAVYDSPALASQVKALHISFLVANVATMTQTSTDYWHRQGLKISVWTPNTREEVRRLCALGVDYILSDYPDYCVEYR